MRTALRQTVLSPPCDRDELQQRARALAGRNIGEIAADAGVVLPPDTRRHKGLVGELVEWALGADPDAGDGPDFAALGVELKTIPLGHSGAPKQSTFVCSIRLEDAGDLAWRDSRVYHKLASVLWVPVEGEADIPLAARRVGAATLWAPSPAEEQALRADWEELIGMIGAGEIDRITAHLGQYLQIRPKAANAAVRGNARDEHGAPIRTAPRGFYLRTRFTAGVLARP